MIAIDVLRDAQKQITDRQGLRRRIKCFFSESDPEAYAHLERAVTQYHQPENGFEIRTYRGKFEDATSEVQSFIGTSFPLIFIDPTGWTGYPFGKISPLFVRAKCEVLINFMYDFINRFAYSSDPEIIDSLAPILGGRDWPSRLDANLPRGLAVEKLFRETLKSAGRFSFVVSTKIDKSTSGRPHFFIVYGTKSADGLKAFRQIEYDTLRKHAKNRATALERKREKRTAVSDMFAYHDAEVREATIDEIVAEQKLLAKANVVEILDQQGPIKFSRLVTALLEPFMLRETNVKDICVELAEIGRIEDTWGGGRRKPRDESIIKLKSS
jgi:three-Cys-motif partner protein